jgi:hypothetical protein
MSGYSKSSELMQVANTIRPSSATPEAGLDELNELFQGQITKHGAIYDDRRNWTGHIGGSLRLLFPKQ